MTKFLILAVFAAFLFPLTFAAVVEDFTIHKLIFLGVVILLLTLFYYFKTSAFGQGVQNWIFLDYHLAIFLGLLLVTLASIAAGCLVSSRRRVTKLQWKASINQGEMQRLGQRYLVSQDWVCALESSFSSVSLFRCRKHGLRACVVFLKANLPFDRVVLNVKKIGLPIRQLVIVYYNQIPEEFIRRAALDGIIIIHYLDLANIDSLCMNRQGIT